MRKDQQIARLQANVRALHRRLAYLETFVIELGNLVLDDVAPPPAWPPPVVRDEEQWRQEWRQEWGG